MNKFSGLKNQKPSLSDKIEKKSNQDANSVENKVYDLKTNDQKNTSMVYAMPVYLVLNHLKVHGKAKINEFVNKAIAKELKNKFPDICDKYWD